MRPNEYIVVAAGCFWGVEELLRKVSGIIDTEVGYAGGSRENANYESVKTGTTGHAEAVRITYDPQIISLQQILELFFQLHDPTTLHRQGGDVGSQYRSAIFVKSIEEKNLAKAAIQAEASAGRWKHPIVTTIEELTDFFPAESYHQDYLQKNPGGYTCHYWRGAPPQ